MTEFDPPNRDVRPVEGADASRTFFGVIAGTVLIAAAAVGASFIFQTPLPPLLAFSFRDFAIGVAATVPLTVFLIWFMRTQSPAFAAFRESQIAFFAGIGFEFTWPRILLMALAAGVCEELMFRGVLQSVADRFAPTIIAIIVTNILFGLLHWRTALYALIAGVVGAYLGVLFWLTGALIAPIATHALYDLFALHLTRQAIHDYRRRDN
ncbi:MAG: CPBP family intramembrane glutamic endopeptidase [Pseudomonadota bacterium]